MATGPEHFKLAEDYFDMALGAESDAEAAANRADALTHALLSLVAATLDAGERPVVRGIQWAAVLKGEEIPQIPVNA